MRNGFGLWLDIDPVGVPVDAERARDAAASIVSGEAYQVPGESWLDRIAGWFGDRLADLLPAAGEAGNSWSWIFVLGLLAVAGYFLVQAIRNRVRSRPKPDVAEVVYGTEAPRNMAVWWSEAERLTASGDFRGAVRCYHQAAVASLLQHGIVDHLAGRTAAEYRDLARHRWPDSSALDALTAQFEAVWYGGEAVAELDVAGARRDAEAVGAARPERVVHA